MITIAAEQFPLTPAIRTHVENNLSRLLELLPRGVSLKVFLSEPTRKIFKVVCLLRIWGKDLVVTEEGDNLYKAIEVARMNLTRKVVDEKDRWLRLRRKTVTVESPTIPANP